MQPDLVLPPLNYQGYLPEGEHEATFAQVRERFVINSRRAVLWRSLEEFLNGLVSSEHFSHIYIDGGFVSGKASPEDIDVILQLNTPFGARAFRALEPFFVLGFENIHKKYSVDLHFCGEGFPHDFRLFFQYLRPQDAAPLGLREGTRKGIVRIKL